jgi:hypothetical protein
VEKVPNSQSLLLVRKSLVTPVGTPSWEADSSSVSHISCICLWNTKVYWAWCCTLAV